MSENKTLICYVCGNNAKRSSKRCCQIELVSRWQREETLRGTWQKANPEQEETRFQARVDLERAANHGEAWCGAKHEEGWECTKLPGHIGDHVAHMMLNDAEAYRWAKEIN